MVDFVHVGRLWDTDFGLPQDLAPHRRPWAYYEILGISRDASPAEIKAARRRLAFEHHPDRMGDSTETMERIRVINDAYEKCISKLSISE